MSATIKVTGPGLNNWFAEKLVKDHGPDGARERTTGPMLAAVESVIAEMNGPAAKGAGNTTGGAA